MFVQKGAMLLPKGVTIAERTMTRSLSAMALSSPLSPSSHTTTQQQQPKQHSTRTYVSRAHPRPVPEFSVPTGLQMVLDGVEERKKQRVARWERNKDKRRSKGIEVSHFRLLESQIYNRVSTHCRAWTIIRFRNLNTLKIAGRGKGANTSNSKETPSNLFVWHYFIA